jgi:hypothetical protein
MNFAFIWKHQDGSIVEFSEQGLEVWWSRKSRVADDNEPAQQLHASNCPWHSDLVAAVLWVNRIQGIVGGIALINFATYLIRRSALRGLHSYAATAYLARFQAHCSHLVRTLLDLFLRLPYTQPDWLRQWAQATLPVLLETDWRLGK